MFLSHWDQRTKRHARFNDIAWSQPSEQYPRGIIAGALDSGALVLWDAEKLQAGEGSERMDSCMQPQSADVMQRRCGN